MAILNKNFSTQFAIYVALCMAAVDGKRIQNWTYDFGTSVFVQDDNLLTSPGQVFGHCEPTLVNTEKEKFETSCQFAMENGDAPIDSPDHVRTCNFTLTKDVPKGNDMYMREEIVAIAKDRAVLRYGAHSSHILFVLNFANCTVANSYIDKNFVNVQAPTKDKFDVIIHKFRNSGEKFRIIFDTDGNIKSNEQSWYKSDASIISAADSPTKGRLVIETVKYFVDDSMKPAVRISAIANDGSSKTLKEYPIDNRGLYAGRERFAESTTYNLVSLCARLNSTTSIKCTQVDLDGNVKFETEIPLDENSPVHSFRLHNLPRGGLLLFIFKCLETVKPVCILREQSFIVKKANDAGQPVGTLKVNENNDKISVTMGAMHVFESHKNEICLSNVRSKSNNWKLTLDVVCLKDDDFTGEISWPNY